MVPTILFGLLLVGFIDVGTCRSSRTIPDYLWNCYRNGGTIIHSPNNMQLLVELLHKLEQTNFNYNIRVLSASLLHSFRIDGIERATNMQESEFVLPYRASGFQFSKYSFLLDLLIPGDTSAELWLRLSEREVCSLHRLLSGGVDAWARGDEARVCPLPGPNQPTLPHIGKEVPYDAPRVNRTVVPSALSRCPLEKGVVQTSWGDVAAGTLLAGVAAALEPQNVPIQDIYRADHSFLADEGVNHLINDGEDIDGKKFEWNRVLETSQSDISNVLAATLAGDIAEMVIRQGPLLSSNRTYHMGCSGRWNDSILPRNLYLMEPRHNQWEMTDAEILGGLDGFILSNYVKEWTTTMDRVRLSQILEMYYSSYGVAFNTSVRACNRKQNLQKLLPAANMYQQTLNLVNVLWHRLGTVHVYPSYVENMTKEAIRMFEDYWPKLVDRQTSCDVLGDTCPMDAILVTDGTWTKYQTEQLVSILSETLDVSSHGSSFGLIHGTTGEWVTTPTKSILDTFDSLANYTGEWVSRLNLPSVLTTVLSHLENKTETEDEGYTVGGLPNTIIIAAPSSRISEAELNRSRTILESLRVSYRDVYILFVSPDSQGFTYLSIDSKQYSEMYIESSVTNVKEFAEIIRVNFVEKTIPKRIITPSCAAEKPLNRRIQYEDHINMGQRVMYRIHPSYLLGAPYVKVQFQGADQGELTVCYSKKYSYDGVTSCRLISGQNEAMFLITHPCDHGMSLCEPLYFIVQAKRTDIKCGDNDCRYPDQIRFFIRHEGLKCRGTVSTSNALSWKRTSSIEKIFISLLTSIYLYYVFSNN